MVRWISLVIVAGCCLSGDLVADEATKISSLQGKVEVTFDVHGIPHIFADSWADAARVIGWLHVQERLVQMEFNRRVARGDLAELVGADGVEPDKLARRLGIKPSSQELWDSNTIPNEMKCSPMRKGSTKHTSKFGPPASP